VFGKNSLAPSLVKGPHGLARRLITANRGEKHLPFGEREILPGAICGDKMASCASCKVMNGYPLIIKAASSY
jgi:hypothetical protein